MGRQREQEQKAAGNGSDQAGRREYDYQSRHTGKTKIPSGLSKQKPAPILPPAQPMEQPEPQLVRQDRIVPPTPIRAERAPGPAPQMPPPSQRPESDSGR